MKTYPLIILLGTMLLSWAIGFYFISIITTPTIIIPLFDGFLWMSEYKGFLGLPLLFTVLTAPVAFYIFKNRQRLLRKKTWYTVFSASQLFWIATIAAQLKIIAFNLGICH
ncbi:hypothetical protein LCM20_17860 [Halobacillus litoralis]|uniref:hypothetical protein n=1 Tax=Halobacillus litoralis TaxID=45668 RepID=UPI001CD6591F|nr:hypothetical protein [Halobacillus litoralis]MCA0972465.1 hypothetical protein [Halobacillus litoralis]